ncbi:unnamed protein product [Alopecurus aequalis]
MATCSKLPLLFVLAAVCAAATIPAAAATYGPFQAITNVDAPYIQELGKWALAEHVKQANDGLRFDKVVDGKFQVVVGLNYVLVINAANDADGTEERHTAQVYLHYWTNTRQLVSFN